MEKIHRFLKAVLATFFLSWLCGCAGGGSSDSSSSDSASLMANFPGLSAVTPAGSYSHTANQISCASACQLTFDPDSDFMSEVGAINCTGNLVINEGSISCDQTMTVTKAAP